MQGVLRIRLTAELPESPIQGQIPVEMAFPKCTRGLAYNGISDSERPDDLVNDEARSAFKTRPVERWLWPTSIERVVECPFGFAASLCFDRIRPSSLEDWPQVASRLMDTFELGPNTGQSQPLLLASEAGPGVTVAAWAFGGIPAHVVSEPGPGVQAVYFLDGPPPGLPDTAMMAFNMVAPVHDPTPEHLLLLLEQ